jgi:V8-like Glu-specific endopeptidase
VKQRRHHRVVARLGLGVARRLAAEHLGLLARVTVKTGREEQQRAGEKPHTMGHLSSVHDNRTRLDFVRTALAALVLLAGCGPDARAPVAQRSDAILGGTPDTTTTDVFLIGMTFNNGNTGLCSALLIGARSLITAAHCVDPALANGAQSVTIKGTNKPSDSMASSADYLDITDVRLHPQWTGQAGTYDIAALLLASPPGVSPRQINRTPLDSSFTGQMVRAVGYGRTDPAVSDSGTRHTVTVTVTGVSGTTFSLGVSGSAGTCVGDSGGPSFHIFPDGIERAVGLHSYGSASCGDGTDDRIDPFAPFVDQWLADEEPNHCGSDGTCMEGCTPADPDCACAPDGVCNAACPDLLADPDCPPDCVANGVCAKQMCPVPDPDCAQQPPPKASGGCVSVPGLEALAALLWLRRRRGARRPG